MVSTTPVILVKKFLDNLNKNLTVVYLHNLVNTACRTHSSNNEIKTYLDSHSKKQQIYTRNKFKNWL